jgi:cobalt-zinc-cadmium efflux system outer membrane protein
MRLEDLEKMALENSPSLAQALSAVRAAEGQTLQAGLYPNPTVGYTSEEFSLRAPSERSQHYGFVEQEIVTAGKLKHNRAAFAQEQLQAEASKEAQKWRVLNTVRILSATDRMA